MPTPRRHWAAATIALAMVMSVMDGAIANVALPTMARELQATPASAIWIVNAYQLAITVCLLPFAALGDKLGYRRVFLAGMFVFTAGSLACALSHTLTQLVTSRVLQGVGAAGLMSVNSALVRSTYPHRLLGRGIGINALFLSMSSALGPTVAAIILAKSTWPWLFAINVPLGLLALPMGARTLPSRVGSKRPFDWPAAVLNALTFGFLMIGVETVARQEFGSGLLLIGLAIATGVLLTARELGSTAPMFPFDLLRIPIFGLSIATSMVSFCSQMLAYVSLPFYFQTILGRSAVETGLLMTPWPIATGIAAPIAGRLSDRHSAGKLGGAGLGVFAIGLLLLSVTHAGSGALDIAWRMAVCGFGFGFFVSPNLRVMLGAAPLHRSGAAGGMISTARLMGQSLGALSTAVLLRLLGSTATSAALTIAAVLAAAAACVSLLRMRVSHSPAPPVADD